ncbi:23S rRNA (adenine(2503)-C(2))-methyltransferase RlmN, partial [Campylobacter volucris]|nr:23S rRNA (adenine(2503)-C(2))-methyltransferase RlmN [Campylobacter volucris]
MINILDYTKEELYEIIKPNFRAKQIFEWIYKKNANDFLQMSSLPK